MASQSSRSIMQGFLAVIVLIVTTSSVHRAHGQLSPTFYATTCPTLSATVLAGMTTAVAASPRMGASILRLHFHDCFVNGCDGSVLLDDTPTFTGEKTAFPNNNSIRGFEVIDSIKAQLEVRCPGIVSCADILALAARDGTVLLGGPTWTVPLGRRDARNASRDTANNDLPAPTLSLSGLNASFATKNLSTTDLVALSGAHTIGQAQCLTFRARLANDTNINAAFRTLRQRTCGANSPNTNLAPLDVSTPNSFDNRYYRNLVTQRGLLHSDQELFNNGPVDALVRTYVRNPARFRVDFAAAMVKMGNLSPLTGSQGEIRLNCRKMN